MSATIRIGISAGDINGIGLEVTLKSLYGLTWPADQQAFIIGDAAVIARQCRRFRLPVPVIWDGPPHPAPTEPIAVWNVPADNGLSWQPGVIDAAAANAAAAWIRVGVQACLNGILDALVTAPISKEGFHRAGMDFPGHTEMLASLTGTREVEMMLIGGPLRVVLATRHIPLADVPGRITAKRITQTVTTTMQALKWMGLKRTRIAVCGLNPHAGEGGHIGREEMKIIAPAIKRLQAARMDVHGPLPGDTVFHLAAAGQYDAVIALYHDQGLAPLKLIAFDSGINITLGLPIVRTSPDHGTAFPLAGKNKANPSSMTEAIAQARLLAGQKNPWKRRK